MSERLPRHVTGFLDRWETVSVFDSTEFKRACYAVVSMEGGSVTEFEPATVGRNYHHATLTTATDQAVALCNAVHPLLGFQAIEDAQFRSGSRTFCTPTHLASLFSAMTRLRVLEAGWLAAEIREDALADLAKTERLQIAYWKPRRIGDIVFNDWD